MAANSQCRKGIATVGKRFIDQIWKNNKKNNTISPFSAALTRKGMHTSVYDKNVDDQARPNIIPDDVIEPQSDKYWGPDPRTGVFGPAEAGGEKVAENTSVRMQPQNGSSETVMEQQAWFRPLEVADVEKPLQSQSED